MKRYALSGVHVNPHGMGPGLDEVDGFKTVLAEQHEMNRLAAFVGQAFEDRPGRCLLRETRFPDVGEPEKSRP